MKRPWLVVVLLGCLLAAVFVLGVGKPASLTAAGEIRVTVHYDHDWAYAETDPQTTVVFTVSGNQGVKATASGLTDDDGFCMSNGASQIDRHLDNARTGQIDYLYLIGSFSRIHPDLFNAGGSYLSCGRAAYVKSLHEDRT